MSQIEFQLSNLAIKKYHIDETFSSADGRIVISDIKAARQLAEQMSLTANFPISTSDIYALGLINEIQHILIQNYSHKNKRSIQDVHQVIEQTIGQKIYQNCQIFYLNAFSPSSIRRGEISSLEFLAKPNHPANVLVDMFLLHMTNINPAVQRFQELFNESDLIKSQGYQSILNEFPRSFESGNELDKSRNEESLLEILNQPALHSPGSLTGQLEFLLQRWGDILGEDVLFRLHQTLDLKREEAIRQSATDEQKGELPLMEFSKNAPEFEQYSPDKDWMPRLVLIAKNSYVWLDQLSKDYGRPIKTLDQIPDEELDKLAGYGITGLWLIGLWERSHASRRIKQRMGNPDAVASAYSLMDYQIAKSLGGWQSLDNLRSRAWTRGIRLSADMVPNHMGIDSTWVMEHPDWFLSLTYSPFANYSFNGEDLSNMERVGIYLEDHYYNKSDAAVVFKRVDQETGESRYIYHGNDGTSMPWNDTAQLDYLNRDVREAVIQTILDVARNFPIIRFDAAMTLASKHIQRLWYPEPGKGGAIPSRTEHSLSNADFHAALPNEFWREVVDRVAQEVPDTLLLAEAFWLMEGYFVRTLGMHRVYNSAFMHMLRDEDNAKYRTVIKNILEFDPQILKRFVNFMNNPDEKSAIGQFGDGDKYFGVCTLLATFPGLPMFGHGQIEGFHEKYGMEYQRAYWNENPNEGLIAGHEWHIFPLLKRRYLFADVTNFVMYDFFTHDGQVNEDVFAFSNGIGEGFSNGNVERALIIYHNKFAETRGWIRTSAAFMDKNKGQLAQTTLGQALGLKASKRYFTIYRDLENGLEYISRSQTLAEEGLYLELKAYQHHAFLDFREIEDYEDKWLMVYEDLAGKGYWSIQARYDEIHMIKNKVEIEGPVELDHPDVDPNFHEVDKKS